MMNLHVWGGSGEHGRSCYRIAGSSRRVLLDCGIKKEASGQYPLLNLEEIPELTAVFLSHAHEDHAMALPLLYKHGYRGVIWTTRSTVRQLEAGFSSWQRFVESRDERLPYGDVHIQKMDFRYLEDYAPPLTWFDLPDDSIRVQWGRSGHLAGAVWIRLELEGKRIFFSGDYSRESELLAADLPGASTKNESVEDLASGSSYPEPAAQADDLAIIDNAYGPDAEPQSVKIEVLYREISASLAEGGRVLLPLPAFGRSQDLLVWICERFPDYPIIVENSIWSGLERLLEDPIWLHPDAAQRIRATLQKQGIRITVTERQSQRMQALEPSGPCLILSNDGMLESPASRWYFEQIASQKNNLIMLTGHVYRGTFANRLIKNQKPDTLCRVLNLCYKVHQGVDDVRMMLSSSPASKVVLVHAPEASALAGLHTLEQTGASGLHVLRPGMQLRL